MGTPIRDIDIADLLTTTLYDMDKGKFTDISQDLHDFIVVPHLLTKRGGLKIKKSGVGIEHTLMVDDGGYSRFVGEYDEDVVSVGDFLKKMKINWTLLTDNLAYTRSEILENRGEARINDVILPRRRALYLRVAKTMERNFFQTPDANDDLTPWGLKYWIVKNATTGFNGGYADGFTRVGNVNLTEVPAFKNYTAAYTAASKTDLIEKMRRAYRQTKWRSPKPMKQFEGDTSNNRMLLVNEDTLEAVENIGEAQNENLGRDLAPYQAGDRKGLTKDLDGNIMFKKIPFTWAEELDSDSTDPVYGIDMATFHALTFKGDNMRLGDFAKSPKQHRVFEAHLDHKHQTICTNRRNNFVISK